MRVISNLEKSSLDIAIASKEEKTKLEMLYRASVYRELLDLETILEGEVDDERSF